MKSLKPKSLVESRRTRRPLRIEPLESRWLLSGDDPAAPPPPPPFEVSKFESAAELEQFLVDDALRRYDGLFGQPGWPFFCCVLGDGGPIVTADTNGPVLRGDHSDTNTQVAGVDEGDLVETDGDFLYILSGQQLVIIDAEPSQEMALTSRVHFEGQPFAQFLMGDRLTVLSHVYESDFGPWWGFPGGPMIDVAMPFFFRSELAVTVLDVSDRAAPNLVQETRLDGSHVDSRAIGNLVYLVTSSGFGLPQPELKCSPPVDESSIGRIDPNTSCVYETRDEYLARIDGQVLELGLPHYTAKSGGLESTGLLTQPGEMYRPILENAWNLLSIVVIDAGDDTAAGPAFATSIPTDYASRIYASTESLYVVNPVWRADEAGMATMLLKFDLDATERRVDLGAVGEVPGQPLNQFSIDEYGSYLRIATTRGWGVDSENYVFVLEQTGESFVVVGRSVNLGAGEQIFAVRFQDERAFVVTFERVDPLFALDLSDPANPRLLGELEIPGFSNYLQPVGGTHLIGIGRNADAATGRVQELQVSLFDVSDLTNPTMIDRDDVAASPWATSEATSDHHAVGWYAEHGVLAIPVSSNEWTQVDRDGDGTAETSLFRPRTELWVWRVDTAGDGEEGVALLGRIEHDSYVRRSVRIGDVLYSISDVEVKAHDLLDPSRQLGTIYFGQADVGVSVFEPQAGDPDVDRAVTFPERSAPQVLKVLVGNTEWSGEFVDWLARSAAEADDAAARTVGVESINQIKVVFSEDVQVSPNDLAIRRGDGQTQPWYGFEYDAASRTATWSLWAPRPGEMLLEIADAVRDMSGAQLDGDSNGRSGGAFTFAFELLPGDVDRSGAIDLADLNAVRNGFGSDGIGLAGDINVDGRIDLSDLNIVRNGFGRSIDDQPSAAPQLTLPAFIPARAGETAARLAVHQQSEREAASDTLFTSADSTSWWDQWSERHALRARARRAGA